MDNIDRLKDIINKSNYVVFFGGAGVSTESGIPDFRSEEGLYKAKREFNLSPEQIISHSFFISNPEVFYKYYKQNMIYIDARPNDAHIVLAKLEKMGKLRAVITQNIDSLHQEAGSEKVYELHGSEARNYCMDCHKNFDLRYILDEDNCKNSVPLCDECGGIIKPDVVLYEEPLDSDVISSAINHIANADALIIGGTSLVVYPAAGLSQYFRGNNLILINKSATGKEDMADLVINEPIGEVLRRAFSDI